jgi:putative transposase
VFADPATAHAAINRLRQQASETGVKIYGCCVMPDHVHLVLNSSPDCDVIRFVGQFKNLVQRAAWERGVVGAFWQKSFWDHFLRTDEDLERVVAYVLSNPVRRGLVKDWREYPFAGSLELNL